MFQLFKDSRNLTLTTGKTLKTRKCFRPNVNLATKRAVEQTISVIAASNVVEKNDCQKEKGKINEVFLHFVIFSVQRSDSDKGNICMLGISI